MKNGFFQVVLRLLCCALILFPHYSFAGPLNIPGFNGSIIKAPSVQLPASQASVTVNIPGFYGPTVTPPPSIALPQLKPQGVAQGAVVSDPVNNTLTIQQNQPNAIIDWETFNIGADASVQFNQKGQDQQGNPWVGAALNRIWDSSPSLIFGKLTADGRIYLINQNGILFGPGSQVNVNSLTASALNIRNLDFLNGTSKFYLEHGDGSTNDSDMLGNPYAYTGMSYPVDSATGNPNAAVSNLGVISAATGGSVFLLGPRVENFGSIDALLGQIGLASGTSIDLLVPSFDATQDATAYTRTALIVYVKDGFGEAVNGEGGKLTADMGLVGMYGGTVNQNGLIRSITAVSQHGQIELIARDKISTGSQSITESPVSDSSDKADSSSQFAGGVITMHGNFENPDFTGSTPPALIDLQGVIDAPSGTVTLNAKDHVFIEAGSSINVGGAWSNETATAETITAQLNSVELADAYGQKGGLLQGTTITTNVLTGSSIGNISGDITTLQKTALERAVNGGTININGSGAGDVIVKQGATLDFSGGGISYSGGALDTTELLSGTNIYNIGNAPLNLQYDKIIGQYTKTYDTFGVQVTYSGLYYGGASQLKTTNLNSFQSGGNAGTLQLAAGTVVLDGQLNGTATRGLFQNAWTPYDPSPGSAWTLSMLRGLEIPRGGNLIIGQTPTESVAGNSDLIVKEIVVSAETTPLDASFGPDSAPLNQPTVISASIVNAAGLGSLSLYANTKITTDSDANIQLSPKGSFTAYARSIEHAGTISVPAGTISLTVSDYILPDAQLTDKIFLDSGSNLDVSGQRIDNTLVGKSSDAPILYGQTGGGTINLKDKTDQGQGVFIQTGAVVDVSGGYSIDQNGKVTGGSAGSLNIQGSNIMLNGDLRGYALADPNGKISGGSITLSSTNISVAPTAPEWPANFNADSEVPSNMNGEFVLAGDRFDYTGFTQIALNSINDIVIQPNTSITTSLVRLREPLTALQTGTAGSGAGQAVAGTPDLIRLDDSNAFMAGPSSFSATAGKVFESSYVNATGNMRNYINNGAKIIVSEGSEVSTAPEGSISLSAPAQVDMSGTLQSLAGTIKINTTGSGEVNGVTIGDVDIGQNGRIYVYGYNRPGASAAVSGLGVNYTPVGGGQVSLTATNNLVLEGNIDVSGSKPVANVMMSGDGKMITYNDASDPGYLYLTFQGSLTWTGDVKAQAQMAGVSGGTLRVSNTGASLDISSEDINKYLIAGFDDLTLQSKGVLQLSGPINAAVGRQLTLDAREIIGADGSKMVLQSPWITLANTSGYLAAGPPASGTGYLTFSSTGWIDLNGSINISGFQDVKLVAGKDIRLSDAYYNAPANDLEGKLSTAGDLIMQADKIYPTTLSTYGLYSGGKTTILPTGDPVGGTIYSAGGSLIIGALGGIEVQGVLAAPMGTITLQNYIGDPSTSTGSRIYLADGSVVTTAGNATVNYGQLDVNDTWTIQGSANNIISVSNAPQKAVTISAIGGDVIVGNKAQIDISGGGSISAYNFQPGIEGTINPLTVTGRYVVFKDNSLQMPGAEIYLQGGGGLSAGMYTLLPLGANYPQNAQYAFMPGAYIIEQQTAGVTLPGQGSLSKDGYPLTVGYTAVADTSILGTRPLVFSVRTATDVLTEGHFDTQTLTAGDAGNLKIAGKTTIIDGVLKAAPLDGFQGGSIALVGTDINVQASTVSLPSGFSFDMPVPSELVGTLNVNSSSFAGQGFREIDLGDQTTNNITIAGGSVLTASVISLTANTQINIEKNAQLQAVAQIGIGEIDLNSPSGMVVVGEGALLHASHWININAGSQDFQGDLQVDHSALTLQGTDIFFVPDTYTGPKQPGLYITGSMWSKYSASGDVTLDANDISFMGSFDLSAANSMTLDAAKIVGAAGSSVMLNAPTVSLKNSGPSSGDPGAAGTATFTVGNAGEVKQINIGGDVLFSGFQTITLNSYGDVTLQGKGSLTTGNANLNISAARVTTTSTSSTVKNFDGTTSTPITASSFVVYTGANYYNDFGIAPNSTYNPAPAGAITITNSGGTPGTSSTPGGMLELLAKRIDLSTILQQDAGTIKLTSVNAGQNDGIFLHSGGQILAAGTDDAPGGEVTLSTDNGSIVLDANSLIDVSGKQLGAGSVVNIANQLDAGSVTLLAPIGGVSINGILRGNAGAGKDSLGNMVGGAGGSFVLDTLTVDTDYISTNKLSVTDMTKLIGILTATADATAGGFTESIDIRARTGNIDIVSSQTITANHVKLTADDNAADKNGNLLFGQINVSGTIDASASPAAGTVEIYANSDLNISGMIKAKGTPKGEDDVILSSANGFVNLQKGGVIDFSAGQGVVYLRAQRNGNDLKINLDGNINGASAVYAEAVKNAPSFTLISGIPLDSISTSLTIPANSVIAFTYNGADYKAQIPAGTYTDGLSLAAAIKTALNYAVDPTGKTAVFDVDYGVTAPGQLTVKNTSALDVTNFMTATGNTLPPSQLGFSAVTINADTLISSAALDYFYSPLTIADGNNLIAFMNNGSFYYAQIPAGTYSDGAKLAAAIKTALNSAGAGNIFDVNFDKGQLTVKNTSATFNVTNFMTASGNTLPPSHLGFNTVSTNTPLTAALDFSSPLTIADGNNVIGFTSNGVNYTAQIPAVTYNNGMALASAIGSALNAAAGGSIFAVDYGVTAPGQLTVKNSSTFNVTNFMTAPGNTLQPSMLGFDTIPGVLPASLSEANNYYNSNKAVGRLSVALPAGTFHLLPGIELVNPDGDIDLGSLDLSKIKFGTAQEPGVLTIRAAGNLNITGNLIDAPTYAASGSPLTSPPSGRNSWGFNLVAGADTSSADYMSVNGNGTGNLTIGDQQLVYTESAPIRFASAGSTIIGQGQAQDLAYMINNRMYYNLASFSGPVEGKVGTDLQINGGAIQTATGGIDISVGGNLMFDDAGVQGVDTFGAIRTTGWSGSTRNYWTYSGGGNITLDVGGNIGKYIGGGLWTTAVATNNSQWDYMSGDVSTGFNWSASYQVQTTQTITTGLATMGGGDLVVRSGGDFLTQAGTFGQNDKGDLIIYAGGNINGRFLNTKGRAEISAMGNFGDGNNQAVMEAFDSGINVIAQGNIELAAIVNPFIVGVSTLVRDQDFYTLKSFNIGYSEDASVSLRAVGGSVTLGGNDPFHNPLNYRAEEILPPTLNVEAGGDIRLMQDFALLPAPLGSLRLIAGGSIDGLTDSGSRAQVFMSDMSPADVYGDTARPDLINDVFLRFLHAATPLHAGDTTPVEVYAGQDIEDLKLFLPKMAEITAEKGDIRDIFYYGQNINAGDVSKIQAIQGNIFFSLQGFPGENIDDTGIIQAGPGSLFLQAGGSITLGNTRGIQTVGNAFNPILGTKGSDLVILSGYNLEMKTADAASFFDQIRTAGTDYSTLMAEGEKDEAQQVIDNARTQTIGPLLGSPSGSGDINMTTSQISTTSGQDNIYIIAAGKLDVGKSTFFSNEQDVQKTGIFTAGGGGINIFANGDINVNESRVMTFFGGDITVWSDGGNINAGCGSKTQVNASPPKEQPQYDANNNLIGYSVVFTPPAVGSGIRAVTYDPDGAVGPLQAPSAGDIYLFASRGTIDAGEAGISGSKVVLGATQILNVGNISFTNGSVGVPISSEGTAGIGTLSGQGMATAASSQTMMSEASGIGAERASQASKMIDEIMTKWLDVKVIDFVQDDKDQDDKEE